VALPATDVTDPSDESRVAVVATPGEAAQRAVLSLLVPGLGQFAQHRFLAGAGQLGTVVAYVTTAAALGGGPALLLAIGWNVYSAIDAYRHDRS
jgi:hypothetical protein